MGTNTFVAIIPARGGSKRIPKKNIRNFAGTPALARTITTLKDSSLFSSIVVTTDDSQISRVASLAGADIVLDRPSEFSSDTALTVPTISDAIRTLVSRGTDPNSIFVCVYPVNPFLDKSTLNIAAELSIRNPDRYVTSVVSYPYPIQRALRMSEDGSIDMANTDLANIRSQELEEMFHDAGQFYFASQGVWNAQKPLLVNSLGIRINRWRAQDIDTEEDWKMAELLYKIQDSV